MANQPLKCDLFYDFYKIPGGSKVEMWVEGEAGEFVCLARVKTKTSLKVVPHEDLFRAPGTNTTARIPLAAAKKYLITLFLNFRKDATATVEFRIVKPAGSSGPTHHSSTPVRCMIAGKKNEEADARAFILRTLQS